MTAKKATSHTGAGTVTAGYPGSDVASSGDPQQIRADIEQTRAELGDSVQALAARTDVKERARQGAAAAKNRAKQAAEAAADRTKEAAEQVSETVRRRPAPVAAALAGLAAVIASVLVVRRRRAAAKARTGLRRWGRRR